MWIEDNSWMCPWRRNGQWANILKKWFKFLLKWTVIPEHLVLILKSKIRWRKMLFTIMKYIFKNYQVQRTWSITISTGYSAYIYIVLKFHVAYDCWWFLSRIQDSKVWTWQKRKILFKLKCYLFYPFYINSDVIIFADITLVLQQVCLLCFLITMTKPVCAFCTLALPCHSYP